LPVVVCRCEAWSLTLWEGHKLMLFENRVGAEEDILASVKGEWRRQYDRQLYDLNCPPFIIRGNNSSRKRWVGHVARMADRRRCIELWWREPRKGDHLEDLSVDGRIILRWIFRKWDVGA